MKFSAFVCLPFFLYMTLLAQAPQPTLQQYDNLPLYFAENQGLMDEQVAYFVQGRDKTLYFTPDGMTLALAAAEPGRRWVVKVDFLGAQPGVHPESSGAPGPSVSYFRGPAAGGTRTIGTTRGISYPDLWPGIDLHYSGSSRRLKYQFVLQPGADPARIGLVYRGAEISLTEDGRLTVDTPAGSFHDDAPTAYQVVDGRRVAVPVRYAPAGDGAYGFEVGDYDPSLELVIDPAILVYCGYIGGASDDSGWGIAVDATGAAYVVGDTRSSQATFPVKTGPDLTQAGLADGFIAKVAPDGQSLVFAGYIGGAEDDVAEDVEVDSAGSVYIAGFTSSTEATFPIEGNLDPTFNGVVDAFVLKLNPQGTRILWSGYIGGAMSDLALGLDIDATGNSYITGFTGSDQNTFPVAGGPDLTYNGDSDVFVAKVRADGTALDYCGYIGGDGFESAEGIAVDPTGAVFVAGATWSAENTFPVLVGPDVTQNGGLDGFIAKVKPDGSALEFAGYIGGNRNDRASAIDLDALGYIYTAGFAESQQDSFPVRIGPDLTHGGGRDGWVAKLSPNPTILWAGYIGGAGDDYSMDLVVSPAGDAYVSGLTGSPEPSLPVVLGPDLTYNGGDDAFAAKVFRDGRGFEYLGYIGGADLDDAVAIDIDLDGNAYVAGYTKSKEDTFPVTVGPDLVHNGGSDAFAAKIEGGPFIDPGGIVNAASYQPNGLPGSGIAQGALFVVTGKGLGPDPIQVAAAIPWPTELGGVRVTVTVGDTTLDCPLYYTSDRQLSGVMRSTTPLGAGALSVTYDGQRVTAPVLVVKRAFGMFTRNQAGHGPAIIQNWNSPTEQPVNSLIESSHPSQTEIIWGTGLGPVAGDDAGVPPIANLDATVKVVVGDRQVDPNYAGRTGMGVPSVDQINFVIPSGIVGCRVPIAIIVDGVTSNVGTIAITEQGKVCDEDGGYSQAELNAVKDNAEVNIGALAVQRVELALNGPQGAGTGTLEEGWGRFHRLSMPQFVADSGLHNGTVAAPGACAVYRMRAGANIRFTPGSARPGGLDAGGAIGIAATGLRILTQIRPGIYDYWGPLGGGLPGSGEVQPQFVVPGWFTADNPNGGADVGGFQLPLYMPETVTWTGSDAITQIQRGQPLTVTWEPSRDNLDVGELVLVGGYSADLTTGAAASFICTQKVDVRTFTVPAWVTSALPVNSAWSGADAPTAVLAIGTTPTGDRTHLGAQGLDMGHFFYWNWKGKNVDVR